MTPKQRRFAEEYVVDFNGTQAAIRAGYSKKTANVQCVRLLANVSIKAFIKERQAALSEQTGISAEKVLTEIAKIAFANARIYVDKKNNIRKLHDLTEEETAAVAGIEIEEKEFKGVTTRTEKLKFWSKSDALVSLARHLGLFNDKLQIEGRIISMEHLSVDALLRIAQEGKTGE